MLFAEARQDWLLCTALHYLELLIHCSRNDRLFYRRKRKERKHYETQRYLKQGMCSTYCRWARE